MPNALDMLETDYLRVLGGLVSLVPEVNPATASASASPVGIDAGLVVAEIGEAWQATKVILEAAAGTINTAGLDGRLSVQERQRQMSAVAGQVAGDVDQLLTSAADHVDQLVIRLNAACLPPRPPTPDPLLQEAQLEAKRAEIRMVLDQVGADYLPSNAADLLAMYAASGSDDLGVWLMTASTWLGLYFQSRGGADLDDFTRRSVTVVTGTGDPEILRARQLLALMAGPRGIRALLTLAQHMARMRLDDLLQGFGLKVG